jgi:prefoldin subunit 5
MLRSRDLEELRAAVSQLEELARTIVGRIDRLEQLISKLSDQSEPRKPKQANRSMDPLDPPSYVDV